MAQLNAEKEEISAKLTSDINELRDEFAAVQRQRDQQMIAAEHQHQQVWNISIFFYLLFVSFC